MDSLRIAIAGLGTVGAGAFRVLKQNSAFIRERTGRGIEIVAVSSRSKDKPRGIDLSGVHWVDDPLALAADPEIDVVVELIGGAEGAAKRLVEAALTQGKSVVTANKALIAEHGMELARLAERSGAVLAFEASVSGGIPIIKSLREGLAANRFHKITGILNGTCNYILTTMWEKKKDFAQALAQAQKIGYAEADPTLDVDGFDAAHKLAILTTLAYGCPIAFSHISVEGIRSVSLRDMEYADELGYVIKLLGISQVTDHGILQRVHPCIIDKFTTLGRVGDAYNGIIVEGDVVGRVTFEGMGAGEGATASSVVGDLIDLARGARYKPFTVPVHELKPQAMASFDQLASAYYLRLGVIDRAGVLADITSVLRDEKISLESFLQRSHQPGEAVQVVVTTHLAQEAAMQRALRKIAALDSVVEPPHLIRMEKV